MGMDDFLIEILIEGYLNLELDKKEFLQIITLDDEFCKKVVAKLLFYGYNDIIETLLIEKSRNYLNHIYS